MPFKTKNYGLPVFSLTDVYSASSDFLRFSIIDNHLAAISSFIGDGVIDGWDLSDIAQSNSLFVRVEPGIGMMGLVVARTFGDIVFNVDDDTTVFVYMQRKYDYIGGFSSFSETVSIFNEDEFPPPSPLSITVLGWDYNFVSLRWDSSPSDEPDFYQYAIYRSTDNFATEELIANSTTNEYIDSSVEENTSYAYRITSIDLTGNESVPSPPTANILTLLDVTPPLDPYYALVFPGDEFVDIMWKESESDRIQKYEVWIQELDKEYNPIGSVSVEIVDADSTDLKIEGLVNGTFYRILIYAVSENNIYSFGVEIIDAPRSNYGPEDVSSISLSDQENSKNQYGIRMNISFVPGVDPYNEFVTERYIVTLIENGKNTSDPIYVYDETSVSVDLFTIDGKYNPVLPLTDYIVKIVSEDAEGNTSNTVVERITTSEYVSPASPSELHSYQDDDNNIIFAWVNTTSKFDHNELSLKRTDLTTAVETVIENGIDYSKKTSYRIETEDIVLNSRYTISLRSVAVSGIRSDVVNVSFETVVSMEGKIDVPSGLVSLRGEGFVRLQWDEVTSTIPSHYQIWRSPYTYYGLISSNFELLDTITADNFTYDDYSVASGGRYYYFVTTVDVFGRESLNPISDGYFYHPLVFGYYSSDQTFSAVTDVQIMSDEYDTILSWVENSDEFDGYEIWRSDGDKASWEKVGQTSKEFSVFIDENALLVGEQNYYYMIRKYRNEAQVVTTSSTSRPVNSVLLGQITSSGGSFSIDSSAREDVAIFSDLIEQLIEDEFERNSHNLTPTSTQDLRIILDKNVVVTNWSTTDNKTFTTTEEISGATSYVVWQSGETLDVPFNVDTDTKTILFSEELTASNIALECIGLEEVSDTLPASRVGYPSATKTYSGRFPKEQLPPIDHTGREDQDLLPLQLPMITNDDYGFEIYQNTLGVIDSIGEAITFYDIMDLSTVGQPFILNSSAQAVAATSRGLVRWDGDDWEIAIETDSAPHKIYYAASIERYFALTGTSVYISGDGITWVQCFGLDGIYAVRDITEDNNNNVYITTDRGVYKLDETDPLGEYLNFEQTTQMDAFTSNAFAIWNDRNSIVVSGENELFSTINEGSTWEVFSEIETDEIVWQIIEESSGYVFALTNNSVWRKHIDATVFEAIASLNSSLARKIQIFDGRIWISSDAGLLISTSGYNIYTDPIVLFEKSIPAINFSHKDVPITSLNATSSSIIIGTDAKVFSGNSTANVSIIFGETSPIIPSVFVDYEMQSIGFTYYTVTNTVRFDRSLSHDSTVTVANQYKTYRARNKGWVDGRYDANLNVYKNGVLLADVTGEDVNVVASLLSVEFDDFTEFDSNTVKATDDQETFNEKVGLLVAEQDNGTDELQPYVSDCLDAYNVVYSNVHGRVRFASVEEIDGESFVIFEYQKVPLDLYPQILSEYEIVPDIPDVLASDTDGEVSVNAVNGFFSFFDSYNKYDFLTINLLNSSLEGDWDNTHREIDNQLQLINSGLPLSLAETHETNMLKMGLFFERLWPGEQEEFDECFLPMTSTTNLNYNLVSDNDWYDVLNSTVDYKEEIVQDNLGFIFRHPTSVLYVGESDIVLVGNETGVISISTVDYSFEILNFNGYKEEFVRDIKSYDNDLYILTDDNLYKSSDSGVSWSREELPGLSGKYFQLVQFRGLFVISTDNGAYYKSSVSGYWERTLIHTEVRLLHSDTYLTAVKNGSDIYYSTNVVDWVFAGRVTNGGVTSSVDSFLGTIRVNSIESYNDILLLATDKGLRFDNSTFYTEAAATSLIDVEGDFSESSGIEFNDVDVKSGEYVGGTSEGDYYVYDGSSYVKTNTELSSIQKIIYVGDDIWAFGYDMLKVSSLGYAIKISFAVPF
jgi:fibronectin type 3 domain-containing protein